MFYESHRRRWYDGENDGEAYLNQVIENFNELLDGKMNPSVHTVRYSLPLDYNINK